MKVKTKYGIIINNSSLVELGEEIKGGIKLDRLLELLTIVKKKFEFYQILKKISNYYSTKEFKEEKLLKFKEILFKRLEEFSEKKDMNDKILIPFIFHLLKKAFFKIKNSNGGQKSLKMLQRSGSDRSLDNSSSLTKTQPEDNEKMQITNNELLIKFFTVSFLFLRVDIHDDIALSSLNYINKYFEETLPMVINKRVVTTDEFFFEYILSEKLYVKFFDILLKYYEYQACVQAIFGIVSKLIRFKRNQCPELIDFFNTDKFLDILKRIIRIHDCNSVIMTNIFSSLYNLIDHIQIENLMSIISFQRLREVFNIFKLAGFDTIHEASIHLVKGILIKKTDKIVKKNSLVSNMNNMGSNDTNKSVIESKGGAVGGVNNNTNSAINDAGNNPGAVNNVPILMSPITHITDEEYTEMITIFSHALIFMRNKVLLLDFFRLSKWVYSVMSYLYTISHIINNINPHNLPKMINILTEKRISELIVECLFSVADKKIFIGIDNAYDILDPNLINIKIMIFRAIFHCLSLVKTLRDISEKTLVSKTKYNYSFFSLK